MMVGDCDKIKVLLTEELAECSVEQGRNVGAEREKASLDLIYHSRVITRCENVHVRGCH